MSISLAALQALLPRGRAWTRSTGRTLTKLLEAIAQEYDRVRGRVEQLLLEAIPLTSTELLTEWEELTRADEFDAGASIDTRRATVAARLVGASPTYPRLEEVLESLGYSPVTFDAWAPFRASRSAAGDALTNDEWQHTLGINVPTLSPDDDAATMRIVEDELHLHILAVWDFIPAGILLTEDELELATEAGVPISVE